MRPCFTLLLAAGLLLPILSLYADKPLTEQERAAALVAQLGSDEFQEREDASAALDRLGVAALPALRAARKNPDPEVRRRVAELLPILECRAETAHQLETPRLRVHYKNTSLAEALADVAQRSGNTLNLGSLPAEMGKRPVTLDGDWTFWEALSHIYAAADVAEIEPEAPPPPSSPQIEEGGFRARGRRVLYLSSLRSDKTAPGNEMLALIDGKAANRPTFQAGALRIRMLGPKTAIPSDLGGGNKQVPLTLEIKPEPRIGWERLAAVRIDQVLDDKGRDLPVPATVLGDTQLQNLDENVIIIWDGLNELPVEAAPQLFALQFPVYDRTGPRLREIRGTAAGWIRAAPEPLITIDNLAKALNEAQTGPDDCRLKVIDCQLDDDGLYNLHIEVTPPTNPHMADLLNHHIVRKNRRFGDKAPTALDKTTTPFQLSDDKGEPLAFVSGECEYDTNATSRVYTVVYKPGKNDKGPAKLVYRDRRCVFIEAPFTLKDVPLYQTDDKR